MNYTTPKWSIIVLEAILCKVNMNLFHLLDTCILVSHNNWDKLLDFAKLEEKMLAIKPLELVIAYIIISQKLAHFYFLGDYFLNKFCVYIITACFFLEVQWV